MVYWTMQRASKYSSFKWANDPGYLKCFLSLVKFNKKDLVLDAGIGTGLVSEALSSLVKTIVGVDSSLIMLDQCSRNGNIILMKGDLRSLTFMEKSFDKVIARNVFHHIIFDHISEGAQKAADECYRVLKKGGEILVGERVPPTDEIKEEYARIFRLRGRRMIFTEASLRKLLNDSGFRILNAAEYWIRNLSVRSWLKKTGLSEEIQEKIFDLHINGSDDLKKAHNLRPIMDDCLIDIKNTIVRGIKE